MRATGHLFFVTPNGVWLTDSVPSAYLSGWDVE
jgi:RNA:NAD 2'-phosphotransferase (TPT1/KptA family)